MSNPDMSRLELFSTPLCPFAHRVRLVLAEKRISYRLTEIDLGNKPREFLRISPHGKVPVLRHGHDHIFESTIISEYLEEVFPEPRLLPKEPARRARARSWIDFANARLFATTASLLYGKHRQDRAPAVKKLAADLRFIETEALGRNAEAGPYWFGQDICLVDLTFYPWFEQLAALERFRDFRMPPDLPRLTAWREAVAWRKATRAVAKPPEFYIEQYARLDRELQAELCAR